MKYDPHYGSTGSFFLETKVKRMLLIGIPKIYSADVKVLKGALSIVMSAILQCKQLGMFSLNLFLRLKKTSKDVGEIRCIWQVCGTFLSLFEQN